MPTCPFDPTRGRGFPDAAPDSLAGAGVWGPGPRLAQCPPQDLEQYAASYSGLMRIERLQFIADHCPPLRVEALKMALSFVQRTFNVDVYEDIHRKLSEATRRGRAGYGVSPLGPAQAGALPAGALAPGLGLVRALRQCSHGTVTCCWPGGALWKSQPGGYVSRVPPVQWGEVRLLVVPACLHACAHPDAESARAHGNLLLFGCVQRPFPTGLFCGLPQSPPSRVLPLGSTPP